MSFFRDLRLAFHSLMHSKSLAAIVILTLALGIGANAAIFTLVRGVLLKRLVNRDENRLVYIRQSAPSGGQDNTTFSVPEIKDIEGGVRSVSEFGDFSAMDFTMVGLGEPRVVHGVVVSGNYFDVMGLRPVLGRLVGPQDGGADAAGVIVLTYRFWSTVYKKDPRVIGKTVRLSSLGDRSATVIGVLEPSVPYPADTEIIGNLVISPHHLSATMVTGRIHRMTELFAKLRGLACKSCTDTRKTCRKRAPAIAPITSFVATVLRPKMVVCMPFVIVIPARPQSLPEGSTRSTGFAPGILPLPCAGCVLFQMEYEALEGNTLGGSGKRSASIFCCSVVLTGRRVEYSLAAKDEFERCRGSTPGRHRFLNPT